MICVKVIAAVVSWLDYRANKVLPCIGCYYVELIFNIQINQKYNVLSGVPFVKIFYVHVTGTPQAKSKWGLYGRLLFPLDLQ